MTKIFIDLGNKVRALVSVEIEDVVATNWLAQIVNIVNLFLMGIGGQIITDTQTRDGQNG